MIARPRTWDEIQEAQQRIATSRQWAQEARDKVAAMRSEDTTGYDATDLRLLAEDIERTALAAIEYDALADRVAAFLADEFRRYRGR